jgi:AbiEi antitoxin C-terminal domain
MRQRLPSVLSGSDLPAAELWAAKLDGELFRLGDCFSPIDEIEQPEHRARAVHSVAALPSGRDGRLIAEQRSAAWIWGALDTAPVHQQLCVVSNSRSGRDLPRTVSVREVVITSLEIAIVGGLRVTTPLRTIVDLARFSEDFDSRDAHTVSRLMLSWSITVEQCEVDIDSRRNLPGKHRALQRLNRC